MAFLATEGNNFSGASHALAEAQREIAASKERIAELESTARAQDQVEVEERRLAYFVQRADTYRATVRRYAEIKLPRAKHLAAASGPKATAARQAYDPLAKAYKDAKREYETASDDSRNKQSLEHKCNRPSAACNCRS